jgi:peptidoglycan/LPS O-acetylase OafA/YrhL
MTAHSSPYQEGRKFYIPCLDGLRGIALLLVFAAHAGLDNLVPGGFGVTIFFFLSGYLITTLLRIEDGRTGNISIRQFYMRRVLRILPPMYITLAVMCVLGFYGVIHSKAGPGAYVAAVTFVTNYYTMLSHGASRQDPGMGIMWSLCIEEHFYLLFPFIYWTFLRKRFSVSKQTWILLTGCIVALAWRFILVFVFHVAVSGPGPRWTYMTTDCRFDSILWGCILAIHNNAWFGDRSNGILAKYKDPLALAGFAGLLLALLYRNPAFREVVRYTLQGISLYPIFYYCVATTRTWPIRMLQWKILRWIGVLSYTLYLCHFYILWELQTRYPLHFFRDALVAAALSLLFACAVRWAVELPLQRLRASFRVRSA